MPELPDVRNYLEALGEHVVGHTVRRIEVYQPHLLKTFEPPLESCHQEIVGVRRLGKRIVLEHPGARFEVLHLMIAGRLRWREAGAKFGRKMKVARWSFDHGELWLTEASPKKRSSLHVVDGEEALAGHDPGGLEPLDCTRDEFVARLRAENHTLKRSLTDPHLFSGIGNAYSDEILHRAGLSPIQWTSRLSDDQATRLHEATREVLEEWIEILRTQRASAFPEKVTAFHPRMAAHGKYGEPCPSCQTPIQRIRYASNETNYCPTCQTGGKLLADRGLSQLLKGDWPKTLEEMERRRGG